MDVCFVLGICVYVVFVFVLIMGIVLLICIFCVCVVDFGVFVVLGIFEVL